MIYQDTYCSITDENIKRYKVNGFTYCRHLDKGDEFLVACILLGREVSYKVNSEYIKHDKFMLIEDVEPIKVNNNHLLKDDVYYIVNFKEKYITIDGREYNLHYAENLRVESQDDMVKVAIKNSSYKIITKFFHIPFEVVVGEKKSYFGKDNKITPSKLNKARYNFHLDNKLHEKVIDLLFLQIDKLLDKLRCSNTYKNGKVAYNFIKLYPNTMQNLALGNPNSNFMPMVKDFHNERESIKRFRPLMLSELLFYITVYYYSKQTPITVSSGEALFKKLKQLRKIDGLIRGIRNGQ